MRFYRILIVMMLIGGCHPSGYIQFYKPYVDATTMKDVELLKPDQEPKVYGSNNLERDVKIARSKLYIPIGHSSFNGGYEDENKVKDQARRIGAVMALVNSNYAGTQTTTVPLFMPTSSTTYHSGSVNAGNIYGGYTGSSTTYGTNVVPITSSQRRYDQTAVFFVKQTKKPKFGVSLVDLSSEQRAAIERNTGAVVDVVVEDTPAFYANVMPGDLLIEVNGEFVKSKEHGAQLMREMDPSKNTATFKVIRNKEEKIITISFDK